MKVVTISSWLNFGHPAPREGGLRRSENFWLLCLRLLPVAWAAQQQLIWGAHKIIITSINDEITERKTPATLQSKVGAERGGQADHPDRSAWAHHTCSKGTTLVACSTPRRLQAGHVHVQDAARPDTTVLVGRLSAHLRRKSPTTVVRHVYICRATDQNSSGVTDHLLLPDHRYGTVCRQICA